jgi:hypothetical protein
MIVLLAEVLGVGRLQVHVASRENATLKGLLGYLQLQPEAAKITPSLAKLEALKNDMVASANSGAADGGSAEPVTGRP